MDVDLSGFVREGDDGARRIDFAIDGMTCAACIPEIENALKKIPGVAQARVNYSNSRLALGWKNDELDPAVAVEKLRVMGYVAHPFELAEAESRDAEQARYLMRCLAVAGFAAMNVMLLSVSVWAGNISDITPETRDMFHWVSALIALPAAAFAGRPFFTSALGALRRRSLNMDVPISLGITLALGMSVVETARHAPAAYFDSALMLIFFLLCGRYLEQAMRQRTRAVAGNVAALRSPLATRIAADGALVQTPTARIEAGDLVLVRPGERAPVDGRVVSGASEVDESIVTGETAHRRIGVGDEIYAGVMNFSGALQVRARAAGAGGFLDEIERLLEGAASARSRYVGIAERASKIYAPVVHLTALATAAGWLLLGASVHDAVVTAIAVLIITCPCALALAVPAVHVVTSGALFRSGVLLNGGHAVERLAEVDTIVFDKTGTLTLPEPRVANADEFPADLVEIAARLARSSRHPLARALAQQSPAGAPYDDAREEAGAGVAATVEDVEARVGSAAFCGVDPGDIAASGASTICFRHGAAVAVFEVHQALRPDAVDVLSTLRAQGYSVEIISGDSQAATEAVAKRLGIADWRGGARPSDKVARLETLKAQGRKTLMVGDGFNDAPALAAAYVSLSPVTAADVAQAAADAVFLGDRLAPVRRALEVSRLARKLMRENLTIAVVYNAIAVPLAIAGHVTPLIAAIAMSGSSLIVTLNALRAGRDAVIERADAADRDVRDLRGPTVSDERSGSRSRAAA
ncbi:MAG: cadmium-translocating P-type ATPase [Hyphomicrobiales bacterium]|nr:cadmium-translocating P-type ATPase [Hyphomicrobiales bacterium]